MDKTYFGKIRTVFIDLDDTIWDFSANSKVAMRIVYEKYGLQDQCPYDDFIACYMPNNESLWTRYHHGEITKEYLKRERFRRSFEQCGIVCNDPLQFDYDYLETIVTLKQVVDGAPELLAHLTKRGPVHVLSNGFANLQSRKLKSGGIDKYITKLILSDDIDVTKPDRRLFDYALEQIFLDPPYAEKSLETAIQRLSEIDILSDGGIIITERPLGKPLAEEFPGLTRSKDYHYGKTTITLLRKTGAGGGND